MVACATRVSKNTPAPTDQDEATAFEEGMLKDYAKISRIKINIKKALAKTNMISDSTLYHMKGMGRMPDEDKTLYNLAVSQLLNDKEIRPAKTGRGTSYSLIGYERSDDKVAELGELPNAEKTVRAPKTDKARHNNSLSQQARAVNATPFRIPKNRLVSYETAKDIYFNELLIFQGGHSGIPGAILKENLVLDVRNHKKNEDVYLDQVRGVIDAASNIMIGAYGDDPQKCIDAGHPELAQYLLDPPLARYHLFLKESSRTEVSVKEAGVRASDDIFKRIEAVNKQRREHPKQNIDRELYLQAINILKGQGRSATEIQKKLEISYSTYYRTTK